MKQPPTIVVITYNRDRSLYRLLQSLNNAKYPTNNVRLVISIDRSDNEKVLSAANEFNWKYGEKIIKQHTERMGLKNHILCCGDLTNEYGSIIMLEDDLFVSPYFYSYAQLSSEFYNDDEHVAGVSLYNHTFNEVAVIPFYPIDDGSDVYFLQIAASWGQLFWKHKWQQFRKWYKNNNITTIKNVPDSILRWPESSWKKHFIGYLIAANKYFIYPRISLTTNYSDIGENYHKNAGRTQVPILYGEKQWVFRTFEESEIKYDAFCEIHIDYIKKRDPDLLNYNNIVVDLYGTRLLNNDLGKYIITSKSSKKPIKKYGLNFKTIHSNIDPLNSGDFFSLTKTSDCYESLFSRIRRKIDYFNFFYRQTSIKMYFLLMFKRLVSR